MKLDDLINERNSSTTVNETLDTIYDIVVEKDIRFINRLVDLILNPTLIEDTNRFAFILVDLRCIECIIPLTKIIKTADVTQSSWLADFMYALGSLLGVNEEDLELDIEEDFIHLL